VRLVHKCDAGVEQCLLDLPLHRIVAGRFPHSAAAFAFAFRGLSNGARYRPV
jgi:hypothetical protein